MIWCLEKFLQKVVSCLKNRSEIIKDYLNKIKKAIKIEGIILMVISIKSNKFYFNIKGYSEKEMINFDESCFYMDCPGTTTIEKKS